MMAQIQPDHLKNHGSGPAYAYSYMTLKHQPAVMSVISHLVI